MLHKPLIPFILIIVTITVLLFVLFINGSIPPVSCIGSPYVVIRNHNLTKVNNCTQEKFSVNGKDISYVEITYGEGMDCPAGCIYGHYYALVVDNQENPITQKPSRYGYGNDEPQIRERLGCDLEWGKDLGSNVQLVYDSVYRWKITYNNQAQTDTYGNQCVLNGYELTGPNGSNLFMNTTFPVLVSNCGDDWECITFIAKAKMDENLCKSINGSKYADSCYSGVAIRKMDKSLCVKISDSSRVIACSEYIQKLENL